MSVRPNASKDAVERAQRTHDLVNDPKYRKERDEKLAKLHRRDRVQFYLRLAGFLVLAAFIALLFDGGRREFDEKFAHLVAFVPQTNVQRSNSTETVPAKEKMNLANLDLVQTDVQGTATLSFPDGSGILVQPMTRFEVRFMDYARSGRRNRNFFLRFGSVFSRISKGFGGAGQTLITTPNAVAAARGTGYAVHFDPGSAVTMVEVVESKVLLKNAGGQVVVTVGTRGIAQGNNPPILEPLDSNRSARLGALLRRLAARDLPPHPVLATLIGWERGILRFLDPVLQPLGFIPGGWDIQDNDNARRFQAQQRLRDLQKGLTDEIPNHVTLHTLAELSLPEEERALILRAFAGGTLESYQKRGNTYIFRARARDSKNTLYEMTENSVREVK